MEKENNELMNLEERVSNLLNDKRINTCYVFADYINLDNKKSIQQYLDLSEDDIALLKEYKKKADKELKVQQKYLTKKKKIGESLKQECNNILKEIDDRMSKANFDELSKESEKVKKSLEKSLEEMDKLGASFEKKLREFMKEEK